MGRDPRGPPEPSSSMAPPACPATDLSVATLSVVTVPSFALVEPSAAVAPLSSGTSSQPPPADQPRAIPDPALGDDERERLFG